MKNRIKITKEQKEMLENFLLNEGKHLDEGLMDTIKYGLSKLGRYKVGGKIFGRGKIDQEAGAKIQQIIDKASNTLIKNLNDKIKEENPQFPNNKDPQQFLSTVMSIAAVYDSIIDATTKNPNEEGYLSVDAANGVINDLREYVKKFLDIDLTAVYSVVNESEQDLMNEEYDITDEQMAQIDEEFGLSEQEPSDAGKVYDDKAVRQSLAAKRGGGDDFASTRMDTLKSNRLPLTLAGVGSSLGAFSWLVNTEWFKSLFLEITKNPSIEYVRQIVKEKSSIFASIKPGEGMTQIMNRAMGLNLSPNSSPQDFVNAVKQLGGGNLQAGIDALSAKGGIFMDPDNAKKVLEEIAKNPNSYGKNLGEMFQGSWAGTGKSVGDLLVTQTGGGLQGLVVNAIVKMVPTIVMKTGLKVGAGYLVAKGLGALLGPIGVGLIATGALVKLMRMKGQKSSRAATLNALYQSIRNIEGGDGVIKPDEPPISVAQAQDPKKISQDSGSTDGLFNDLKSLFQFIVNNRGTMGTGAKSPSKSQSSSARDSLGGRTYQGGQIMKGGNRAQAGGQTQSGRERFFANQNYVREGEEMLYEGKFFKDKRVITYLSKNLKVDQLQKFEELLKRIEYVRNTLRKSLAKTNDNVIKGFLNQLDSNPIMMTNFEALTNANPDNEQDMRQLLTFIKETLNTVYSTDYKTVSNAFSGKIKNLDPNNQYTKDNSMVGKMKGLGGGNINKIAEVEAGYGASMPNKSFSKDAQSRTAFKKNLANFLKTLIGLFQYLYKLKTQGGNNQKQQQQQQPQQQAGGNNNQQANRPQIFERKVIPKEVLIENEIEKIKKLIKY